MTYIFGIQMLQVVLFPGVVLSLRLISYPDVATQGEGFTLSCIQDFDLLEVSWVRNNAIIFNTRSDTQEPVVSGNSQSILVASGRISVSTSLRQHNVTLMINSTLDDGSVWLCYQGVATSIRTTEQHILEVSTSAGSSLDVTKDITHHSSQPTVARPKEKDAPDYIPLIAGIVAGTVIVVSVVLVTILCVRRHRNIRKQDTVTTEVPIYSTMSRDHDTDNQYTQLDPRLNQNGNEATQDTPTDVYYNTVSEGRDSYEKPPLHHSVD